MNKRTKLISLAVVALLTVAPTIAATAQADTTTQQPATTTTNTQPTASSTTTTTPVAASPISVEFTQDGKKESINPDGKYFQVSQGSLFNPTSFLGSNGSQYKIIAANDQKITVDSNTVDTAKAGSTGVVKLTTTDSSGKTTSISYTVFIKPNGLFQLNLPSRWVNGGFNIGTGAVSIFYQGDQYYIGDLTTYTGGEFFTSVSKISEAEANKVNHGLWIQTKYLANSKTTVSEAKTKTATMKVMHAALLYDENGKSLGEKYASYREVTVNSSLVAINGTSYYKLSDRDAYIKATNISGKGRVLKHNAYVYATSKRRADYTVLRKGQTITTYGGLYKFKNGKRYYRVAGATATNKRYVKVANFE